MGSMNNNWLSFPLSPVHSSLSAHLHSSQTNQFSLGLVSDTMDHSFQNPDWNLISSHGGGIGNEVPKVADFLGVEKSDNQTDLSAFNQIPATHESDYLLSNCTPQVAEISPSDDSSKDYESQGNVGNLQSLTLSMGTGKGTSSNNVEVSVANNAVEETPRRAIDTFGQRTSIYRGVTKHRWTGRYEAHLWDNSCRREGQSRKGRQGGYDREEKAARAYDLAALKYWGTSTTTNFPISIYEKELEEMKHMTRQEFVASLRRKSSGFSRGASMYRGVTRHHQHGRWQARIGRVAGNKDLYLGTFSTEEEAAEAYDIAAIKFRGLNAVTNFDMNRYDVKSILESNTLPIGGASKRLKETQDTETLRKREEIKAIGSSFYDGNSSGFQGYPMVPPFEQTQPLLALQNQQNYHYTQDPHIHQNYMNHQLHQNPSSTILHSSQGSQFHQGFFQNQPTMLHGLMTMGSSSSLMGSNGSSSNSYDEAAYFGNGIALAANPSAGNAGGIGSMTDLGLVKVDYDINSGSYGGWPAESVHGNGANPGSFTMWNDN
ncbi:AP2/ERF domain [Macleaya cordata]|uniref:AP2/ERF domain n=1 Tax=Macleaya cordata TaxID=56857 RepID=A0A200QP58_MACCD|nr:AP2/ERF domain [Macleaya cordata]